jgi:hypothetical protein
VFEEEEEEEEEGRDFFAVQYMVLRPCFFDLPSCVWDVNVVVIRGKETSTAAKPRKPTPAPRSFLVAPLWRRTVAQESQRAEKPLTGQKQNNFRVS